MDRLLALLDVDAERDNLRGDVGHCQTDATIHRHSCVVDRRTRRHGRHRAVRKLLSRGARPGGRTGAGRPGRPATRPHRPRARSNPCSRPRRRAAPRSEEASGALSACLVRSCAQSNEPTLSVSQDRPREALAPVTSLWARAAIARTISWSHRRMRRNASCLFLSAPLLPPRQS
jgi:hypothetical protein